MKQEDACRRSDVVAFLFMIKLYDFDTLRVSASIVGNISTNDSLLRTFGTQGRADVRLPSAQLSTVQWQCDM